MALDGEDLKIINRIINREKTEFAKIKNHRTGIVNPFLTKTRNEFMTVEDGLYMSGADRHSGKRGSYE